MCHIRVLCNHVRWLGKEETCSPPEELQANCTLAGILNTQMHVSGYNTAYQSLVADGMHCQYQGQLLDDSI